MLVCIVRVELDKPAHHVAIYRLVGKLLDHQVELEACFPLRVVHIFSAVEEDNRVCVFLQDHVVEDRAVGSDWLFEEELSHGWVSLSLGEVGGPELGFLGLLEADLFEPAEHVFSLKRLILRVGKDYVLDRVKTHCREFVPSNS